MLNNQEMITRCCLRQSAAAVHRFLCKSSSLRALYSGAAFPLTHVGSYAAAQTCISETRAGSVVEMPLCTTTLWWCTQDGTALGTATILYKYV